MANSAGKFAGFTSPTYTQVPDQLLDELMPDLTLAELRIVLYITRRTFGFKKTADNIAMSQLVSGITTKAGRKLDGGTGLSARALRPALAKLVEKGIIRRTIRKARHGGDLPCTYSLNLKPAKKNEKPTASKEGLADSSTPSLEESASTPLAKFATPGVEGTSTHNIQFSTNSFSTKSSLNTMVDDFYKRLGRERLSKTKRERGLKILKDLKNDGFSEDELDYALKWLTRQHADTKSLDRLNHVMDQALADFQSRRRRKLASRDQQKVVLQSSVDARKLRDRQQKARQLYDAMPATQIKNMEEELAVSNQRPIFRKILLMGAITKQLAGSALVELEGPQNANNS